jgi:hypothetical protein
MWWIIGILGAVLFLACLRFTKVEEGTAKAIVRLGAFRKIVMAWKDYELDEEWNVKPVSEIGKKLHLPGGLRFVGFWPLDKVYTYKFRWRGIELVEAKEKVEFREKNNRLHFSKTRRLLDKNRSSGNNATGKDSFRYRIFSDSQSHQSLQSSF